MAKQFWKFRNLANKTAELTIDGELSSTTWWGDEVTPKIFAAELEALGDVNEILVKINSGGGDLFAGYAIYNALASHPAKIIARNVGLTASAATFPALAGDEIESSVAAMWMWHNPLVGLCGYYNSDDLAKLKETADEIKESMVDIMVAKFNKTRESIVTMLNIETWKSGTKAYEEGFCTKLINLPVSIGVETVENTKNLVVNNVKFAASAYKNLPQEIEIIQSETPQGASNKSKEVIEMTLEQIKNQHPELFTQIYNSGIADERKRIQEIENVAMPGYENLVSESKFTSVCNAGELATKILAAQKAKGQAHIKNVADDAQALEKVSTDAGNATDTDPIVTEKQDVENKANMILKNMNKGGTK